MPGPELKPRTETTGGYSDQNGKCTGSGEDIDYIENEERPEIATLVFLDLETTGLPSDAGKKNVHITEMCLVAIDRHSFQTDKKLRVLNKINLCIRPRFQISPGSMMVTGLYNDMLECQEQFDDSVPKLLEYFFRRLQKPICLLAHNGDRFDFPVLQSELNRLRYALGSDIVCADTLSAFRAICLLKKQAVAADAQKQTEEEEMQKCLMTTCHNTLSEKDIDILLSQDLESFTHIDDSLMEGISQSRISNDKSIVTEISPGHNKPETSTSTAKKPPYKEFLSPSENEKTPERDPVAPHSDDSKNHRKRKVLDPANRLKYQYTNKKKIIPAKRVLFNEDGEGPSHLAIDKIKNFSLQNLYNHFFHEDPPHSHYAEDDCISLSKVCQKISNEFLRWIDENSVAFSTVDGLW